MPSTSSVLAFAFAAALVTVTPGLDTALVLRSALNHGRVAATATATGVCLGLFVWATAAATGVSALLTASEVAYDGLRLVGSIYMALLGLRFLRNAFLGRRVEATKPATACRAEATWWTAFRSGFFTNMLNPKVGAFYVALLPQFIPEGRSPVLSGVLLGLVHNVETMLWFGAVIVGAELARRLLARRSTERWIEGLTGAALVGFGAKLARTSAPH